MTLSDTALSLMAKDREAVQVLSSSHLISISMTYSKTLGFLVKTKTLGLRSTLKITSRHARMPLVDRGIASRSFLLEVDCSMTFLKIWRRCFLSVALTPLAGTLRLDSMDLASTAGLSLSAEGTWSLHTLTVRDSSSFSLFSQSPASWLFFNIHDAKQFSVNCLDKCMISLNLIELSNMFKLFFDKLTFS